MANGFPREPKICHGNNIKQTKTKTMAFKMKGPSIHKGTAKHTKALKGKVYEQLKVNREMDKTSLPDGRPGSSSPNKILGAVVGGLAKKALGGVAKKVGAKIAGSKIGKKVAGSKIGKAVSKASKIFGGGGEDSPADYKPSPVKHTRKDDKTHTHKTKESKEGEKIDVATYKGGKQRIVPKKS